jgi:hypothetical protein
MSRFNLNLFNPVKKLGRLKPSRRIRKYIRGMATESMKDLYENIMLKWEIFNMSEIDRLVDAQISFMVCPSSIQSTDDGKGLVINRKTYSQIFSLAGVPHEEKEAIGIGNGANPYAVDRIYDIANNEKIDTTVTQILYKMPRSQENSENNKELVNLETIRRTQLKLTGRINKWLNFQERAVEAFSEEVFKGIHRQLKQLYLVRVDGESMEDVQYNSSHMQMELQGFGFNTEVPYTAQLTALKASCFSNELMMDWASKVLSDTAAAMWTGKSPDQFLDDKGILIGYLNQGKDYGIPLYLDLERDIYDNKHFAVMGGSGKGKTTLFLTLLWNAIAAGCDFIHIFPKQDMGTDALAMIRALGGQLLKIGGSGGIYPNPLKIIWNPETHGDTLDDMYAAYQSSTEAILTFFHMLVGSGFSVAMQSTFKRSLKELYVDKKFIDEQANPINIDTWLTGKWPRISMLVQKWYDWLKMPDHADEQASLKALIRYATDFLPGQALHGFDNDNDFDPSGRYITIDISGILGKYQDAVTVLLINIINSRMRAPTPEALQKKRRVLVTLDEGPRLLMNPGMAAYTPTMFREARASKVSILINGQDLKGIKPIIPVLKSNTDAIIFMCGMSEADIKEFEIEFPFSATDKSILGQQGKGKFLFYKEDRKLPGRVIPTKIQRKVLHHVEEGEPEPEEEEEIYTVYPELAELCDQFGVIPYNWITELNEPEIPGYTRYGKVYPVTNNLSKVNFVRNDILADINAKGTHEGESIDHWITKVQMAGERIRRGCTDVVVNTWGDQGGDEDPDVTGITPDGKRFGDEYAHPGSRNKGRLEAQMNNHRIYCDNWICVCQTSNEAIVAAAVGKKENGDLNYRTRGDEYTKYLDSFVIKEPEIDVMAEMRKADEEEKEAEFSSLENSSSPLNMNQTGTDFDLEAGEVSAADGSITEGVA